MSELALVVWLALCLARSPMGVCQAEIDLDRRPSPIPTPIATPAPPPAPPTPAPIATPVPTSVSAAVAISDPSVIVGWASQYGAGVSERVIRKRQEFNQLGSDLPPVDGFVALVTCDRLGEVVWIRPVGAEVWERFLVIDCSGHANTTSWMNSSGILAEVDHETAVRWSTVGRGIRIEMVFEDTPSTLNGGNP